MMIKIDNLTKEELDYYSKEIALAFLDEPGSFTFMSLKEATKLFKILLKAGLDAHALYATSENKEGILICWDKAHKPNFKVMLKLVAKMIFSIPLKVGKQMKKNQSNWMDIEKRYQKFDNYLYVFLITVRKEYQHKGYFKQIMSFAKNKAIKEKCVYFLDTDSETKKDKYVHEGMKVVHQALQKSGVTMFLLEDNN